MIQQMRKAMRALFHFISFAIRKYSFLSRTKLGSSGSIAPSVGRAANQFVRGLICLTGIAFVFFAPIALFGQMDQGTITGVVQDKTGAVIPNASVRLTNTDTGLVLQTNTDGNGIYAFPPVKIGSFKVSATAPGFQTTTQENVHLDLQARLNIVLVLVPGGASETVTVTTAPPLIETQNASVGQVMSTKTIDLTPLNGRNWVYIAQLSAGVDPGTGGGSPGSGTGDFVANGQRAEQNDFILDGVDNNSESPNFENQASWAVLPPPDALAEFKIQTADFSAEFGHSAGAVINTSIKSGTDALHGDLWEYVRNTSLDARDWDLQAVPVYHENQFGATLGLPIVHNKLFFFGYSEANRIIFGNGVTNTVPTALMRQGNFSELLNPALTSNGVPVPLYVPGSAGTVPQTCNGQNNVLCSSQIDAVAQNILKLYPLPNTNGGKLFSNYVESFPGVNNTWQWGARMDWNINSKDQAFARFSYWNEPSVTPPPLGLPLDGSSVNNQQVNEVENFALSETHIFTSTFANELRFGYNYGNFAALQSEYAANSAAALNLGGIPYAIDNGGLPSVAVSGIATFGSKTFLPNYTWVDGYQILDNLTKMFGNHSIRFGVDFESHRSTAEVPPASRGTYSYTGRLTSIPGQSNTGFGAADFLQNQMNAATLSNIDRYHIAHRYLAGYFQDDWRVDPRLTVNLGARYDYYQPPRDTSGDQASFRPSAISPGSGQGVLVYPNSQQKTFLSATFLSDLSANNVSIQYSGNPALTNPQFTNFSPRVGVAFSLDKATVLRAGFGMFYGGQEGIGGPGFLENYPFQFTSSFTSPSSCKPGACAADGLLLETGFQSILSQGLANYVPQPALVGVQPRFQTPYSENFNFTVQRQLSEAMAATIGYVGAISHHLQVTLNYNQPDALTDPRLNSKLAGPYPTLGTATVDSYIGSSNYNSLQATLEKQYKNGLHFLASYTWAHSLDDAYTPLTTESVDPGYRDPNLIGISNDYSNSPWDTRQRVTFNGYYDLPFGAHQRWLNHGGVINALMGGWASDLEFTAETGIPFNVTTDLGSAGPNGVTANATLIHNPFTPGGTPDPSNPALTACASSTKNRLHWYNPCAFANPPLAFPNAEVAGSPISTTQITGLATLPYLGGRRLSVPGPGYERINMSMFKTFPTFHEQYLQFRADAFNLLNTPSFGPPSTHDDSINGGLITSPRSFQNNTPDARFFQLSGRYVF
jgi:hypothetical protein